ncbi:uncharacterized protein LOC111085934 [Limulus polyphemus]|uniref:Uncharacterized protein LOC111085934 n=1 Tax=Limulus polyphemus TaxID=6850 RepID=A0ABM1SFY1_LIMPO|nr:uncharacterized protein LOC111085934 [Limulus polyphemus]
MTSAELESTSKAAMPETTTLKKGLLWQQRDKFFSRWKERYFVLTLDYLACFKKGSKVGTSEMGSFQFKVNLADVDGLQWADKKRDGVIAIKVGQEGQLLLWTPHGLDDWMFSLRDAMSRSKGRREVLRKSQTLVPQLSDVGLTKRHLYTLQHTLSDSYMQTSLMCHHNTSKYLQRFGDLRPVAEKQCTPYMGKRSDGMSVSTDIEPLDESSIGIPFEPDVHSPSRLVLTPRLAPQCSGGSYSSLISLGRGSLRNHFERPSPRSLQVSPALSQRSLYAQHILSNPEVAPSLSNSQFSKSGVSSATSEFSFIHPNSPVTSLTSKGISSQPQNYRKPALNTNKEYTRSVSCSSSVTSQIESPQVIGPPGDDARPCSIHGQPLLTIEKSVFSTQPPDLIPLNINGQPTLKQPYKRKIKIYSHTKSDSHYFNAKLAVNNSSPLKGSLEIR